MLHNSHVCHCGKNPTFNDIHSDLQVKIMSISDSLMCGVQDDISYSPQVSLPAWVI